MATTPWRDMTNQVAIRTPEAPRGLLAETMAEAAWVFFSASWTWVERLPEITVEEGTALYEVEPPEGAAIAMLDTIEIDGESTDEGWMFQLPAKVFWFHPPKPGVAFTPIAFLAPLPSSKGIPDWLALRHEEAIRHGALHRLLAQKNAPWYDMTLAEWHRQQFDDAIGVARRGVFHGHTTHDLRVEPRRWV